MNIREKKIMGERLKRLREKYGLTQDELAEKLHLKTRASISSYEAGRAVPSSDTLNDLADFFKVSTDYILGRDHEEQPENEMSSALTDALIDYERLGSAIKTERKAQGITQTELAELVGVSQKTISQYELGYQEIPEEMAEKIANAFGYSYPAFLVEHDLWGGEIPEQFDGSIDAYNAFKKAEEEDQRREAQKQGKELISEYLKKRSRKELIGEYLKKHPKQQEQRTNLNDSGLPKLNKKDELDIAKQLEKMLNSMDDGTALAFDGEPMDEETKALVRTAIESNLKLTKQLAKKKFTPKKYRDWE
ncbi:helix-turn-helix domain-containing protein [Sporolactobacillus shoreicorticis]|uniref:Helix-turn-helix domain-containing protein n=1 Tax=Sporolactobacillus shoreicorticis TaxID=1923877 RepID=A0ABW5RZW4_9BACL|nr:helix-turn-helix domain-containing protein [Sporolactobacillus shoreicorticis]MCO7125077.1 helix-turn-helix domain-containing protein [Sporolactobacillus shoreicorticis]